MEINEIIDIFNDQKVLVLQKEFKIPQTRDWYYDEIITHKPYQSYYITEVHSTSVVLQNIENNSEIEIAFQLIDDFFKVTDYETNKDDENYEQLKF